MLYLIALLNLAFSADVICDSIRLSEEWYYLSCDSDLDVFSAAVGFFLFGMIEEVHQALGAECSEMASTCWEFLEKREGGLKVTTRVMNTAQILLFSFLKFSNDIIALESKSFYIFKLRCARSSSGFYSLWPEI